VDYGLLGATGALTENPRHYRDPRTGGMLEKTFEAISKREIFAETGLQFMQLNSLYQLHASKLERSPGLSAATRLLFMPDLLSYWLSGVAKNELTIASTSQFYNPAAKQWSSRIFNALGLPLRILGEIVQPGTRLGELRDDLQQRSGLERTPVFATASHDTAAAVAAVPAEGASWCYISSGTWSLMGVELDQPIINDACLAATLTNEVGAEGRIRLLKNIAGLWLVQECRRAWQLEGREYSYEELTRMAGEAEPFGAVIDVDAFLIPGDMPARLAEFCRKTGQKGPEEPGGVVRMILESLALRYRQVLERLESVVGRDIRTIHIVGGGSKNGLLNHFVAAATNRQVVAGPSEATAAGNVLVQAMGDGALRSLEAAREVVRRSFDVEQVAAHHNPKWDEAYRRYGELTSSWSAK
jgi:rhamnulokinase